MPTAFGKAVVSRRQVNLSPRAGRPHSVSDVTSTKVAPTALRPARLHPAMMPAGQKQKVQAGDRECLDNSAPAAAGPTQAPEGKPPAKLARIDPAGAGPSHPGQAPAVVLMLVGLQGSGKSTFSSNLLRGGTCQSWVRINQDSIARGRGRGTREQCISAMRAALQQGRHVIIDRANVTPQQREPFLEVAREFGADAHCVFLDLPVKACMSRAAQRAEHEGGLQGHRAYAVVGMTQRSLTASGPPQHTEGFKSILRCTSDAEANAAVKAWETYSPGCLHPTAAGTAAEDKGRKAQPLPLASGLQTLDKFFTKKLASLAAEGGASQAAGPSGSGTGQAAGRSGAPGAGTAQATGNRDRRPASKQQQQEEEATLSPPAPQQQPGDSHGSGSRGNAFQTMMAAARLPPPLPSPPPHPPTHTSQPLSRHTFRPTPVINALLGYADHPERHAGQVLHVDDRCVLVFDKYPKAKAHALVVARAPGLQGPLDLRGPQDADLVRHMKGVGLRWAEQQRAARGEHRKMGPFVLGFHSVPSMRRLHLHVVSRDFDSPALKTKKHWNSFTTGFFLGVDSVLAQLEGGGTLQYDLEAQEALLKGGMTCHRCGAGLSNMPRLKEHLTACKHPLEQ